MQATGIGGTTQFLKSAEVPTGIGGINGTVTVHVIDQDVPLLLPIGLCKALGMALNMNQQQITWETSKMSLVK